MKIDHDLVRELLLAVEKYLPEDKDNLILPTNRTEWELSYHVELLQEGGLIEAAIFRSAAGPPYEFHIFRLTWHGHDYVDNMRSISVWSALKDRIGEKIDGVSIGTMVSLARQMVMEMLRNQG